MGNRFVVSLNDLLFGDDVNKASFGGDRSAAGRYAAEQRWKGHVKRDDSRLGSIVERVREQEGMTVRFFTGEEPVTGYVVARREFTKIVRAEDFFDEKKGKALIRAYLMAHKELFDGESYLGLWYDKANGEVVLDVAENMQDRSEAVKAGVEWNQQYIWDVENATTIDTGGTGDRETESPDAIGKAAQAVGGDDAGGGGRVRGPDLRAVHRGRGGDAAEAIVRVKMAMRKGQPSSQQVHVDAPMGERRKRKRRKGKKMSRKG